MSCGAGQPGATVQVPVGPQGAAAIPQHPAWRQPRSRARENAGHPDALPNDPTDPLVATLARLVPGGPVPRTKWPPVKHIAGRKKIPTHPVPRRPNWAEHRRYPFVSGPSYEGLPLPRKAP